MQPIGTSCSSFFVNNMMRNIIVADNLVKIIIKTSFAYFLAHQNGMHGVAAGACNRAADGVFINEWQLELISSHSVRKRTSPKTEVPLKVL